MNTFFHYVKSAKGYMESMGLPFPKSSLTPQSLF